MAREQSKKYYIIKDNQDCLVVYQELVKAFHNSKNNASPYLNLIAVFFHDLMRILTGYVLKKNELEGPYTPSEQLIKSELNEYPYIDYKDILEGIKIENKIFSLKSLPWSYKKKIYSVLSGLKSFNLKNGRQVAFAGLSVNLRKLLFRFIRSSYKIDFPASEKIYIPNIKPQLAEIGNTVEKIFNKLSLPGNHNVLYDLLEKHILMYCSLTEMNRVDYSLVVTGTLLGINNRILAAKARSQGIPVIFLLHGDGDGILDEPVFGYGELTFPSFFIGYGKAGEAVLEKNNYLKGLYEQPLHVSADSSIIKSLYHGPFVEKLNNIGKKKIMYVPTSFSGFQRYGPFRDTPDTLYAMWQKSLFEQFPNLILKIHPKQKPILTKIYSPPASKIIYEQFQKCLGKADVFMFDYISTASSIAAATNKPIIYFNIGLRNLTPMAEELWKKRCIWIDVDLANPGNLSEKVNAELGKECINEFSEYFSIRKNDDGLTREDILLKTISEFV